PASVSPNGDHIVFTSEPPLLPNDDNELADVYMYEPQTGLFTLVSVWGSGLQSDGGAASGSVSEDGTLVAFISGATNWPDSMPPYHVGVYLRDLSTNTTRRLDSGISSAMPNGSAGQVRISSDGHVVAFSSNASNLVAHDQNGATDVFVHVLDTGATTCVS